MGFLPICIFILKGQTIDQVCQIGFESIKAADLRTHLSILASDSLEGRETTFPGQKKAANYIASVFRNLKLKAIGDNGTYFQHFDVEVARINPETKIITEIGGVKKGYFWRTDFIAASAKDTTVSGPVAFVGFTDTELDSTAKSKLAGRIVFVFIGKTNYANDISEAATRRRFYAIRQDAGAVATMMIPDYEGPATFQYAQQMIGNFSLNEGMMGLKNSLPHIRLQSIRFIISPKLAEEVLKLSGKSLKQIRDQALQAQVFTPLFLDDAIVTVESKLIQETKQTENVISLLPGSDPDPKMQVVAFTAHYDHLGKSKDGIIYHGADDDGSGTATVLELAEAFTKNPIKPMHSLLFITFVGEEKGLFGSQYYTNNPIIPLNQTIADLNMDMIGRIDTVHEAKKDTNYIYVIRSNKISFELDSLLQIANKESGQLILDYTYNGEYDPEQYYRRSDHFNFAKNGVPIVYLFDGIYADNHKPTDTVDKILFERMVKIGRMIYSLGWKLANLDRLLIKKPIEQ